MVHTGFSLRWKEIISGSSESLVFKLVLCLSRFDFGDCPNNMSSQSSSRSIIKKKRKKKTKNKKNK